MNSIRGRVAVLAGHLDMAKLRRRMSRLTSSDDEARARMRGISRARSRQLVAGAVVADEALEYLGYHG